MDKLEWCRLNAPISLRDLPDAELLDYMSSSYERFCEDYELEFIDLVWQSYDILRFDTDAKTKQVNLLWGSGFSEPNDGIEYCFVPTKRMLSLENQIKECYDKINIIDHEITVCNEVFYTSKIEGAETTIKRTQEIHNGEHLDINNLFSESMILGGFNATKYLNLVSNKVTEKTLLTTWNILVDGCCNNEDIRGKKYRIGNVQVGNHVGLNHILVEEAMRLWLNYYNSNILSNHPFIKAALLHFTFESIHPFCDGNGRLGRLLMNNFLIMNGYDKIKAVSFSRSIEKNRLEYDNAFRQADNAYSDCTYFIEYMLRTMLDAMLDTLSAEGFLCCSCNS